MAGCRVGPGHEVCFNDPTGGVNQKAVLFRRLRQLINAAKSGDQVNVAMYTWTEKGRKVTDALVDAHRRGASVAVVVDSHADAAQVSTLQAAGVPVSVCTYSCLSGKSGIQHAKLFLLRIGGRRHTVVSSSNLTGNQRDVLANDLVHSWADDQLYEYYLQYWVRLFWHNGLGFDNEDRVFGTSQGNVAMVFPRTDRDPVLRILRSVRKCKAPHNKVWVAAARFTRVEVRTRLIKLRRKYGCDARFVIGPETKPSFAAKLPQSRTRKHPIHHKLLILDATIGKRVRRVVYTGSQNFTKTGLNANDEIWTGYSNPFVFDTYTGYFQRLYAGAAR